ncbi:MAG: carboxypeptidase-like regulatory domain-containing protein [Bacteroidales bacterium]
MKKLFLILICLNSIIISNSQVFKGYIKDKSTENAIGFVSVFIDGTTVGTITDNNGYFELNVSKYINLPISISALGYQSVTLNEYTTDINKTIFLTPKEFEIEEVVVTAKKKTNYKYNLKLFKNQFLGLTPNALKCKIENENEIRFTFDPSDDTLKAFSPHPLEIENQALGYHLTYYLEKFEYSKSTKNFIIKGSCIFRDDIEEYPNAQKSEIIQNRKQAYIGSRIHFFRTLWGSEVSGADEYFIKNSKFKKITFADILIQKNSIVPAKDGPVLHTSKYLKNSGIIYIHYPKLNQHTTLEINNEVQFDKNGYCDQIGLIWEGYMAKLRVGDQLPFDYSND